MMYYNGLIGIVGLAAAIWVIYDILANNRGLSTGMKVFWIILALLFSIITAIVYYLVRRNANTDLFRK